MWSNPQETADLFIFTEEILHGKYRFLCYASQAWFSYVLPTIIFIIFWDSLMFYQIFFSPQVRRCAIITYKHSIYGLPNDLRKWVNNQFHNILRLFDALPNFSLTASENMRHDYPQTRHKWAAPRENQSPKKTKKYQETAPTMKDQPQAPHQNESPTNTSRKLLKTRN